MIKQSITYENFDGELVTEDHYFHLSKSELIDMELGADGGMSAKLQKIIDSNNGAEIMKIFKEIVGKAYGQRVDGSGSEFYKTDELAARFMGSLAFDAFLTTLLTDASVAVKFVNGVIPKDLQATAEVRVALATQRTTNVALPGIDGKPDIRPSGLNNPLDSIGDVLPWAFREPTQNEMMAMNPGQLQDVYRRKFSGWAPDEPVSM
jgi:hypothetical protein